MAVDLMYLAFMLVSLVPLLIMQRSVHREIQTILLIITRRADVTIMIFSVIFLPGILLHEGSHFLTARLLGVRTGRFSIFPVPATGGRLQLGFVETAKADPLREAIIGVSPLLAGGAFVAYVGLVQLGLLQLWNLWIDSRYDGLKDGLEILFDQPDFWLWFYLIFVVSSTMMPSASDRRAWLPLVSFSVLVICIAILVGAGPWMLNNLSEPIRLIFGILGIIFGISALVHALLLIPAWVMRRAISWATGIQVN